MLSRKNSNLYINHPGAPKNQNKPQRSNEDEKLLPQSNNNLINKPVNQPKSFFNINNILENNKSTPAINTQNPDNQRKLKKESRFKLTGMVEYIKQIQTEAPEVELIQHLSDSARLISNHQVSIPDYEDSMAITQLIQIINTIDKPHGNEDYKVDNIWANPETFTKVSKRFITRITLVIAHYNILRIALKLVPESKVNQVNAALDEYLQLFYSATIPTKEFDELHKRVHEEVNVVDITDTTKK